jgi:TRAP-type C4-dicarboxylate transport system permease small subunit
MKAKLKQSLSRFEDEIAGFLMAVLTIALALQVITRYVFNEPLSWTEEVSRHLFVWMVFFGASGAIRERSHVAIELLVTRLPRKVQLYTALLCNVMVLFFLGNLLYWGAKAVDRMWSLPTATLELPVGLVYLVIPLCAALMMARTVVNMVADVRSGGATLSNLEQDVLM